MAKTTGKSGVSTVTQRAIARLQHQVNALSAKVTGLTGDRIELVDNDRALMRVVNSTRTDVEVLQGQVKALQAAMTTKSDCGCNVESDPPSVFEQVQAARQELHGKTLAEVFAAEKQPALVATELKIGDRLEDKCGQVYVVVLAGLQPVVTRTKRLITTAGWRKL